MKGIEISPANCRIMALQVMVADRDKKLEALRAENEKLRAALKPFAECDPTYFSSAWFTDDQLRAAAAAIRETE